MSRAIHRLLFLPQLKQYSIFINMHDGQQKPNLMYLLMVHIAHVAMHKQYAWKFILIKNAAS